MKLKFHNFELEFDMTSKDGIWALGLLGAVHFYATAFDLHNVGYIIPIIRLFSNLYQS